jgi:hypothetical protein
MRDTAKTVGPLEAETVKGDGARRCDSLRVGTGLCLNSFIQARAILARSSLCARRVDQRVSASFVACRRALGKHPNPTRTIGGFVHYSVAAQSGFSLTPVAPSPILAFSRSEFIG